jgi:hypothetical protein
MQSALREGRAEHASGVLAFCVHCMRCLNDCGLGGRRSFNSLHQEQKTDLYLGSVKDNMQSPISQRHPEIGYCKCGVVCVVRRARYLSGWHIVGGRQWLITFSSGKDLYIGSVN